MPPDPRVLDLDVVDLVGRVGGLGGRKSGQSSRQLMEAESGQRMDGQMTDGQTMDRWKQNARTESGAQNGWTESEADLKEVRKNILKTPRVIKLVRQLKIPKPRDQAQPRQTKIYPKRILELSSHKVTYPTPIPGKRHGSPFTIKGWGRGRKKSK